MGPAEAVEFCAKPNLAGFIRQLSDLNKAAPDSNQAAAGLIRWLPDQNQAEAVVIRRRPDQNPFEAVVIRTPVCEKSTGSTHLQYTHKLYILTVPSNIAYIQ